jgi:hypothetical protein
MLFIAYTDQGVEHLGVHIYVFGVDPASVPVFYAYKSIALTQELPVFYGILGILGIGYNYSTIKNVITVPSS